MESFADATAVHMTSADTYSWRVPEGWRVGRGAWGGLVLGAIIAAIAQSEPDAARVVRSVSAELGAPALVGQHEIVVARTREGSTLSTWSATASDADGAVVARALAVLAQPRASAHDAGYESWGMLRAPDAPPATSVPVVAVQPPFGPEFGRHVEYRPVHGAPVAGPPADTMGWVRLRSPVAHTAASLIALVDAWWPATLTALERYRPVATTSFSANLLVDPASITADEPLLHHGTATGAHDGFTSEQRRLWSSDGRLVVDNLQSIALIA